MTPTYTNYNQYDTQGINTTPLCDLYFDAEDIPAVAHFFQRNPVARKFVVEVGAEYVTLSAHIERSLFDQVCDFVAESKGR